MEIDNFFHSATIAGAATSLYDLRPLAEFKVTLPRWFLATPYVFVGPGIDIQFASASGQNSTSTSFDIVTGLGMLYPLTDHSSLFIEGKYNFTFPNNVPNSASVQDIPVEAGMLFKL